MFDFDNFREIWSTIKKNKLRTFLTGFAVSWGIFMLITLLGAGNGLRNGIIFNFRRFSANTVEVWGRYTTMPYKGNPTNRRIEFKEADLSGIKMAFPEIEYCSATISQTDTIANVSKQKIKYKRADGLDLTATVYLPAGYDKAKDGPLPVLMWAYPREYKSKAEASQVRGSQYMFTNINYGSPVYWVLRGFCIMENVEMPIVSTSEGAEPNDDFIEQLTMNAEAAVKVISEMGVGDPNRVAVGGHSYGAFMTANLLTHTKLFKAGIARSGAYNRTLTPFGFQTETRTYWEVPEIYNAMSPFMSADKLHGALLIIHGEMDNNSGTFPIQSERLFSALKGHGAIARYVVLPYESHGYAAKENILHLLYECDLWLDRYVKNAKK